jgi:hypothetical protein
MAGGRAGVDTESVDFDEMGDLDRGAGDVQDAGASSGPGAGYGMASGGASDPASFSQRSGVGNTGSPVRQADMGSYGQSAGIDAWGAGEAGQIDQGTGTGTSVTMGTGDVTGGMGSGAGDDDGFGSGGDMDAATMRGDQASTGTPGRTGLGGTSSGTDMSAPPEAGSGMANPADMGDQG